MQSTLIMIHFSEGEELARKAIIQEAMNYVGLDIDPQQTYSCPLLNTSACDLTESSDKLIMFAWNSLPRETDVWIRLPLMIGRTVKVYDIDNSELDVEYIDIRDEIINIPGRGDVHATKEAVFLAPGVPALGKQ